MADDLFVIVALGFMYGLYSFYRGFLSMKYKRLMENLPTSKMRSIAMGLVEVKGTVADTDNLLVSPFQQADCVYYRSIVQEPRGKNRTYRTIKTFQQRTPFFIRDKTGQVLVDPKKATIDIPRDWEGHSNWGKPIPAKVMQFLEKNNLATKTIFGINRTQRYYEYVLMPGDVVYVIGTAGKNPHVQDGTAVRNMDNVMIQKGKNKNFFYISDTSEKNVISKFSLKIPLQLYGGSALSVGCLAFLLLYLGVF